MSFPPASHPRFRRSSQVRLLARRAVLAHPYAAPASVACPVPVLLSIDVSGSMRAGRNEYLSDIENARARVIEAIARWEAAAESLRDHLPQDLATGTVGPSRGRPPDDLFASESTERRLPGAAASRLVFTAGVLGGCGIGLLALQALAVMPALLSLPVFAVGPAASIALLVVVAVVSHHALVGLAGSRRGDGRPYSGRGAVVDGAARWRTSDRRALRARAPTRMLTRRLAAQHRARRRAELEATLLAFERDAWYARRQRRQRHEHARRPFGGGKASLARARGRSAAARPNARAVGRCAHRARRGGSACPSRRREAVMPDLAAGRDDGRASVERGRRLESAQPATVL